MRLRIGFGVLVGIIGAMAAVGQAPGAKSTGPNPDANGIYSMKPGVSAPKPISMPDPEFSELARKKKHGGKCLVGLIVDAEGNPQDVHIVRSAAEGEKPKYQDSAVTLDEKAVEAVRRYRFQPAMFEGKPVPVKMNVEINFKTFKFF